MQEEITYMAGIVLAGFIVNFGLRALPFVLFAGRDRDLPRWVERVGSMASPIVIAALIVYSYSGLAWRTAYPYLAGALTVGLHAWRRNPLFSIVAGTLLYMAMLSCGCSTARRTIELDAQHPLVRVAAAGVFIGDTPVRPERVAAHLADFDVPRDRTIHIMLSEDVRDLRQARFLMACLAKSGYTRPMLVTKRHAESIAVGRRKPRDSAHPPVARPKKIRYKKARE